MVETLALQMMVFAGVCVFVSASLVEAECESVEGFAFLSQRSETEAAQQAQVFRSAAAAAEKMRMVRKWKRDSE